MTQKEVTQVVAEVIEAASTVEKRVTQVIAEVAHTASPEVAAYWGVRIA